MIRSLNLFTGPGTLREIARFVRDSLTLEIQRPEARALAVLAVEEAAANILEHGYQGAPEKPVSVEVRTDPRDPEVFSVALKDRAPLIDVTTLTPGNLRELAHRHAERGRGMAMIHLLTQDIAHRPRAGHGNELILIFGAAHLCDLAGKNSRDAA
jgi:anti-sigma regulatory factor (Ser/Thr protein kinase)